MANCLILESRRSIAYQRAFAVNVRLYFVPSHLFVMSNITLPMELMLRDTLPTRTEQLLTRLRFLPRELYPQSINGLKSQGFEAPLISDLKAFKDTNGLDMPFVLALFFSEFFKAARTDYVAKESITRYLKRRSRRCDIAPLRRKVAEIVKTHFRELHLAALGPFVLNAAPCRIIQLY